jgi:hypothetical protein
MAQAPKLSADRASFVRDIVSDPKAVPDVMLLYGYLGASSEEGHERLYLSPDLTNYVEVPTAAILHQMAAPKEQDPHGGVTLWVKKDAALVYKMAPAAEAPGPQPAALGAPNLAVQTLHPHVCTVQCNTRHPYCGTVTPACSYGASCWCLPPAAAAMAAAGPQLAAAAGPAAVSVGTCPPLCVGRTDVTPCVNTHAVTCAGGCTVHCHPSPAAVCGGGETYIGCGHTLYCQTLGCIAGQAPAQPQALMAAQCIGGTAAPVQTIPCSLLCPQTYVVNQCGTFHTPCCPILTYHSVCCPVSPFCPEPTAFCPGSLACPGSIACGLGQQVPGQQAAFAMARGVSGFCTPGCSPVCTGFQCNTPAHPCTPHCPM